MILDFDYEIVLNLFRICSEFYYVENFVNILGKGEL